ncbi:MAG: hypothetical protein C0467_25755 [Planctomycetaceae bacterium]|nr:hypothetical protein [Planctomycetaceae bacterium]
MTEQALKTWIGALAQRVATTLSAYRVRVNCAVEVIALDCHPWNGLLELSLLTAEEIARDPALNDAREMAAWEHYNFGSRVIEWRLSDELEAFMRSSYNSAGEYRTAVADRFIGACAIACYSELVQQAVARYALTNHFRMSVSHPDDGREIYPPN